MNVRRIALVGQPNAGKSTLFNGLVGYRAVASNFPGTTVEALRGRALVGGRPVEIVDLPGAYSLLAGDPAEEVTRRFLLSGEVDAVVQVADASILSRSLELTFELSELGLPFVLCLNMMDEAEHKGIQVEMGRLAERLGVPVVATVASRGVGLRELLAALGEARPARMPAYAADVEKALGAAAEVAGRSEALRALPRRYAAAQALADARTLGALPLEEAARVEAARAELAQARGEDPAVILADERHAQAARLFEAVATVGHARVGWRERLDDLLMHPVLAYPVLLFVLFSLFWTVFRVGSTLEGLFLPHLEAVSHRLAAALGPGLFPRVAVGAFDGLVAGVGIVLPYLVPFLFLLAFFEDVGYLPRVAYLLDGLMHRIGLHGKSVIPLLLGYGCSVPAVMATRILEDERDRVVTAALALLVPCAAITVVVFGLVGRYVGPTAAFGLYLLNVLVVVMVGWGLTRIVPGLGPGLILEIPPYRPPRAVALVGKVWLRMRGFVVLAWPLLIATSAAFAVAETLGWTGALNAAVRFITWPLGLPPQAGVPLVFGVLRKELSLVMLGEAFAPAELATALSVGQMVVFTVFVLFYVPCVATVAALGRELGWRRTGLVVLGTTGLALLLGVLARLILIR